MKRPMPRTLAILRKELIHIVREPRTLLVALAMPVVMLLLYGYAISSDIKQIPLGVVDWSRTSRSRDLVQSLTSSGYFTVALRTDRYADLAPAMDHTLIKAAIVIPPDFDRLQVTGRRCAVQVLLDGSDPNMANVAWGYSDAIIGSYNARAMLEWARRSGMGSRPMGLPPIDLRARVWYNEELKSSVFIVPGLIAIVLMATSALLTSGTISRERERGTIEQLVASPIQSQELMLGKVGAFTVLAFLDVLTVVLLGILWFGVPFRGSPILLTAASGLFLMCALGLGLMISAAIPSQQAALTAAIMATMVPSIILSGFYFPISSMPAPIQAISYLVPARYFMEVVRGIFLRSAGLADLSGQLGALATYGTCMLLLSVFSFRKRL